ncbi:MAG: hypothetical protein HYW70_00040 [Candidatus Nealsonbacteria bacterium]|nr:hypothetical protein [Candidatus Nealsonbacteria bacterium]
MFNQDESNKINNTVREFFRKISPEIAVSVGQFQDQTLPISVQMDTPQILIGEGGRTLAELQHVLRLLLKKGIDQHFYVNLDINDYKKKKIEYLKETAKSIADEVSLSKKTKEFPAMPAFERRVIHLELASRTDVVSESVGQEPERRIVIKPCGD